MHEADDELREIKREIIESRGLVIRTNNLTNALSADIKSIARRQLGYEGRIRWNSATFYIAFVVAFFVGIKFVVDARVEAIEATGKHLRDENSRMKIELDELKQREADRHAAELEAAKFYNLVREGRRVDVVKGWDAVKGKPLTKAESQFLGDAVDRARVEQASLLYLQGLESSRLQRWQEAASAFEESLHYDDAGAVAPQTKLELSSAYRKLHKPKDAITLLTPLTEQGIDKEVQDDALELLAWCQADIEAYNDAKNTWRALLRRFPDSHYTAEAKIALQALMQSH
jgi:TolA-binding protein